MKACWTLVLIAAWLVVLPSAEAQERKSPDQGGALKARRGSMYDRIRKQLDLDDQQAVEYDAIVDKYKKKRGAGLKVNNLRKLMRQMREAREAGDTERVAEIRRQIKDSRGNTSLEAFFDEVDSILRDDQREKLTEIRQRMSARRGPGSRDPLAQLRRLRTDLKLSDDQAAHYDELLAKLEEQINRDRNGDEDTRALLDELMKAAQNGDEDRVKELRKQLPKPKRNSDRAIAKFLDEVESFLEPEQKQTLDRYRRQLESNRNAANMRTWFRYVRRLDLDREQRQALRDLEKRAARVGRGSRKGRQSADDPESIKQELRSMLNDEQVAQFDSWLEKQDSRKRGGRKGRRHSNQPRPADTP